ncbi:ABC transporter ATP-binding protein [Protaetiibacter sp. 10F1B-8-1]|uniref:ABC transporter ATP-binding protein n=1 Tax=Protaetiibacter mangrovi TaxID=2970926 RepID=A0ABT1ZIM6_9MICO|nr:ABC transporter ATP-binding protein [Protaetiibacter mangrovi]
MPARPAALVAAELESSADALSAEVAVVAPELLLHRETDAAPVMDDAVEVVEAEAVVDEAVAVDEAVVEDEVVEEVVQPEPRAPRSKRRPVRATAPESPAATPAEVEVALSVQGLTKYFGGSPAVDGIDLVVAPGSFFGIVGPNGAGKTTTLSMITGLLRPDDGVVRVFGLDVWQNATLAKRKIGVLPDRLRLFDRLTGAEFLYHAGALRGLDRATIAQRAADLSAAFGLEHSLHRLVSDYSAGMTKKIAIAAAMIHAPRLLVLDEPFESVDPVSAAVVIGVLRRFVDAGGTVILSSHSMELTERVCDGVAIIADGRVLAEGRMDEVLEGRSLEERFVELAGGEAAVKGMEWLQNFSD